MKLVVDSSAIVAILLDEALAKPCLQSLARSSSASISAVNYVEAGTVLAGRVSTPNRERAIRDLDAFLDLFSVTISHVTPDHARLALRARIEFGRGFGAAAGLNFGDCFAYALAKAEGAPLLFVGEDFSRTDIASAL